MRELLALQLRFRGTLLLARDVDCYSEYSCRFVVDDGGWTAAARRDPSHGAVAQDHAKLGLVMAAVFECTLDRGIAHGTIVGMDASTQRGVIDGGVRREAEDSLVLDPDSVLC